MDIKNILLLIYNFIKFILLLIINLIFYLITILTLIVIILALISGQNPNPCTGSAFNFLALGLFGLAGVFIIGIIAGLLGSDEKMK